MSGIGLYNRGNDAPALFMTITIAPVIPVGMTSFQMFRKHFTENTEQFLQVQKSLRNTSGSATLSFLNRVNFFYGYRLIKIFFYLLLVLLLLITGIYR